MVKILRKQSKIISKSTTVLFVFFIIGMNIASGKVPEEMKDVEMQGFVNQPLHTDLTWFLDSVSGAYYFFADKGKFSDIFYNFTITDNSLGNVSLNFDIGQSYNPQITERSLGPGESYCGNFTFVGTYGDLNRKTLYTNFIANLETGTNATFIFSMIIWDYYVYKVDLLGYITIGVLSGLFIIIVFIVLRSYRNKKSPKL